MNKVALRSIIGITISIFLIVLISSLNEPYSIKWKGYSTYLMAGLIALALNWIAFIPSYIKQTEHYYDIVGSLSYLSVIIFLCFEGNVLGNPRAMLIAAMGAIWTIRLGSFLFMRIKKSGADSRFDEIKTNFLRFWVAWTLQALWVFLTLAAALVVLTSNKVVDLGVYAIIGLVIWVVGFGIEVIADRQKTQFKEDISNKGKFISQGLWAYSRHPNYFGEIMLWTGVFVISIPVLQGWQWISIISPIFIFLLLKYVSGVNMLEKIADKRWGGQADYEAYKKRTSELILLPSRG